MSHHFIIFLNTFVTDSLLINKILYHYFSYFLIYFRLFSDMSVNKRNRKIGKSRKVQLSALTTKAKRSYGKAKYNSAVCERKLCCAKFIWRLIKATEQFASATSTFMRFRSNEREYLTAVSVLPAETFQCLFPDNVLSLL